VPDFGRVFLMLKYTDKHLCPKLNGYRDNDQKFETLTGVTHLLIAKFLLILAGICGFCNVNNVRNIKLSSE
jgi:hypothetical protein